MKPGERPNEAETVRVGGGVKSYCELWGRYTNCREVGRCTYGEADGDKLTIFDVLEDE